MKLDEIGSSTKLSIGGIRTGAPVESASHALAFYVLTLLDAKGRERVNSDLTQAR